MEQVISSLLKNIENNSPVEKIETAIAQNIDDCLDIDSFYKIPLNNLVNILNQVHDISFLTAMKAIKMCTKTYGSYSISLLNAISLPNADLNECINLLGLFTSSPLCTRLKYCYEYKNDVEVDWNYEIDKREAEIKSLKAQLAPKNKEQSSHEINPNTIKKSYTSIHEACTCDLDAVKTFINKGVSINSTDLNKETPLLIATKYGKLSIVKYLVERGADLERRSMFGYTAFARACELGYMDIIRFLYNSGADIDTKNDDGWTPLFYAARENNLPIVRFLIEKSANKDTKNNLGKKASFYTTKQEIRNLLN